jgi:hypothetical protein
LNKSKTAVAAMTTLNKSKTIPAAVIAAVTTLNKSKTIPAAVIAAVATAKMLTTTTVGTFSGFVSCCCGGGGGCRRLLLLQQLHVSFTMRIRKFTAVRPFMRIGVTCYTMIFLYWLFLLCEEAVVPPVVLVKKPF